MNYCINLKLNKWLSIIIPLLIASAVFFYVCGPRCLNPSNIAWLADGDSAQHYLGWAFYKNSPWYFPLGLNPDWGLENSSSIIYADALPVFSILFKCFKSFLPEVFQFYGIWYLCCFILQSFFAWRLLSLFNINLLFKTVATIFFTFSPILFLRLGGHQSLVAHFLILWCLCLYYADLGRRNTIEWMICLGLTVACHPYLSFMCLMIFGAFVCKEILRNKSIQTIKQLILLCLLCLASMLLIAWQVGLFVNTASPASDVGYGFYKFNLNGFFNPLGQSYFLKTLPHGIGDYEGFSYLGLGLLLFLFSVIVLDGSSGFVESKYFLKLSYCLFLYILLLFLLALSNNISFGNWQMNLFSVKDGSFLHTFRATGRFVWPLWYFLILYAFVVLQRLVNKGSVSLKFASFLIILLLALQLFDFNYHVKNQIRPHLMTLDSQKWGTQSSDWKILRKKYNQIRLLNNPGLSYPKWRELSLIAVNNEMKTNVFWLARSDSNILAERKKIDNLLLKNHNFDGQTIYVLSDQEAAELKSNLHSPQALIKLDGFNLLLPRGL